MGWVGVGVFPTLGEGSPIRGCNGRDGMGFRRVDNKSIVKLLLLDI